MKKYNAKNFVNAFYKKTGKQGMPDCPYCGGHQFTSTDKFASIVIGEDLDGISLGASVPSGMIICTNCGHVEFFALGPLGLLNQSEENNNV